MLLLFIYVIPVNTELNIIRDKIRLKQEVPNEFPAR